MALFVVLAVASTMYQRAAARDDASAAAVASAGFAARTSATALADSIALTTSQVGQTAATPGLSAVFEGPSGCQLTFGGAGVFTSGHLDLVSADGEVACSSRPLSASESYAKASWLGSSLSAPTVSGPLIDDRTGKSVVIATAPIPGGGVVAGVLDLDAAGPALAATYGGPEVLEFVVTKPGGEIVTRSVDAGRWVGRSTAGTPFDPTATTVERLDLDGVARLYASSTVPGVGWQVHVGADQVATVAAAETLARHGLLINLTVLAVLLLAALFVYQRITGPLRKLSVSVRAAASHDDSDPIVPGGPSEVVALGEDCRHLVEAAENELATAARLAAIVESSGDPIIGKSLDGTITSWNASATDLYGYPTEEAVGQPVTLIVPPERRDELDSIMQRVRDGESVSIAETQRRRRDGHMVDVSLTVSPIFDARRGVVGASSIARDLTAMKTAEAERAALASRMQQSERLESLGSLAGGIAHDFNNLLNIISGYADVIASDVRDDPQLTQDIAEIQTAARSATRLTGQLLIFAKREIQPTEAVELNAVVEELQPLLARTIGENIDFRTTLDPALPSVLGDRGQVEQVLLNLVINARDAMSDGGTLTVETNAVLLDESFAEAHPGVVPGSFVELSVSDTGSGMSPETAAHVFEPFFTTKPVGDGTGLGLATVYGVATKAGGTVTLYSEPGIGTTIRVFLAAALEAAASDHPDSTVSPVGSGETILVVEDEPAVMRLTTRMLERNGYRVLQAATARDALRLSENPQVQLLLTDSIMPLMSGQKLAAAILTKRPHLAVLYMSGYTRGVLGPQQVIDPDHLLITKPFTEHTLLQGIRDAIAMGGTDGPS